MVNMFSSTLEFHMQILIIFYVTMFIREISCIILLLLYLILNLGNIGSLSLEAYISILGNNLRSFDIGSLKI